jgi:hypothetical protein
VTVLVKPLTDVTLNSFDTETPVSMSKPEETATVKLGGGGFGRAFM